ncbi:MAG: phospholipid carrier-dependent glycosyltransferase, partial [Elusimicrobia bacterium]|nr:phospholipid carrier-dependent glycosyltransferase [Elusimicrobiota bacterium]
MKKLNPAFLIIVFLTLFYAGNNAVWLKKDSRLFGKDNSYHLRTAIEYNLEYRRVLNENTGIFSRVRELMKMTSEFTATPTHPPKLYLMASLFNPSHFSIFKARFFVNFVYYIILIVSLYYFGKKLFDKRTALTACFIISFYPIVYIYSRNFKLDFPLLAMVSLSLALWAYTEDFKNIKYSLLLGLALGLAMITKIQILIFIAPAFIYSLFKLVKDNEERKKRIVGILITSLIASLFFVFWWGQEFLEKFFYALQLVFYRFEFIKNIIPHAQTFPQVPTNQMPLFTFGNISYYPFSLTAFMSFPLMILFLVSFYFYIRKKGKNLGFFLFNIVFMYLVFTYIPVKSGRNMLPFILFASLISAWFIWEIKERKKRGALLCLTGGYSLVLYLLLSWVLPNYGKSLYWPLPSRYYLHSSYEPFKEREGYKVLFPISWPIDYPAIPEDTLGKIYETETFVILREALEAGKKTEVDFRLSILMVKWGHTDLWYHLAL